MVVTIFDDKNSFVLLTTKPMPTHVKRTMIIIQITFRITEVVINKYGYPCREVDSQNSLKTFAVWTFETFLILFPGFEECMLHLLCC